MKHKFCEECGSRLVFVGEQFIFERYDRETGRKTTTTRNNWKCPLKKKDGFEGVFGNGALHDWVGEIMENGEIVEEVVVSESVM